MACTLSLYRIVHYAVVVVVVVVRLAFFSLQFGPLPSLTQRGISVKLRCTLPGYILLYFFSFRCVEPLSRESII